MSFRVVPYEEKYHEGLRNLEGGIVQGKHVQLQIVKKHFLDRASVFESFGAFTALNGDDTPIASAIGARTSMVVNGIRFDVGIGFDLKVSSDYRKRGIGQLMSTTLFKEFFAPEGLQKEITTVKKSNIAIRNMLGRALKGLWFYEFVYLTIPVGATIDQVSNGRGHIRPRDKQLLRVTLFDEGQVSASCYRSHKESGLAYFKTFEMYKLRITNISLPYRLGIRMLKVFDASLHARLPAIGDTITFATLFNHSAENILMINEVLAELRESGVGYLMVCCRRGDVIFRTLKDYSINTYGYFLVTDFPLSEADAVTVDVRCL